ncbi:hypothetical protein IMSHALPRED_003145 [Imshaugia aleurites]|uniref:Uncharacterized protein n=1 Tax=Imshaugia aleurites TaxID=172621 RepID=A0A8H3PJ00_9LECA|nr:hypothetical protein IMSHALPRED_003145 [Imshaugia aleurites]
MPPAERLKKLDQILLLYTKGDEDAVEGLKLSYMALMSIQAKFNDVDKIQKRMNFLNFAKTERIKYQIQKINDGITELTLMIFPDNQVVKRELLRGDRSCQQQ